MLERALSAPFVARYQADYRPEIDGLRAVAVLAVLVFHAAPAWARGGFVGVDIFFVISGFLISRIILGELAERRFSFLAFYGRRARRLFPALCVVLAASWIAGWFIQLPFEFAALGRYMLAGAGFASNLLTFSELGYFDPPAATKPLLHLWSLGVEEQFYLVAPLLFFIAARFRSGILISIAALFAASFLLNVLLIERHPSLTFYMPFTRLWEFLAGSVLAWREVYADKRIPVFGEVGALGGAILIGLSIAIVPATSFPGFWALLPVAGAFLLIGARSDTIVSRLLSNRVFVLVGLISYPLYLWHWPLMVMGREFMRGHHNSATTILAVVAAFVLAWLTYRFVERPIRTAPPVRARRLATAAVSICLAAVAFVGYVTARDGLLVRFPEQIRNIMALFRTFEDDYPPVPPLGAPTNDKGPLVIAWGDSHAQHLMPGLRLLQGERTFRTTRPRLWDECPDYRPQWFHRCHPGPIVLEKIMSLRPDIAMLAYNWLEYKDRIERMKAAIEFLKGIGTSRIVVVGPVPWFLKPPRLTLYDAYVKDRNAPLPDRMFGLDERVFSVEPELKEMAERLGATYVSPRPILCNEEGCLARLNNATRDIVQIDGNHFTAAGSYYLIKRISPAIFGDAGASRPK
jgi:peptidoglycan/LPS O-acetylase OafA/YrhL